MKSEFRRIYLRYDAKSVARMLDNCVATLRPYMMQAPNDKEFDSILDAIDQIANARDVVVSRLTN